jgi:hypothetical protein
VSITLADRELHPDIPANRYVVEQTHVDEIVIWQDETGCIFSND